MKSKTLLVHPPFQSFFEYYQWGIPINCCQLAGDLKNEGIEAFVYDGEKYFKKDPKTANRVEMVNRQSLYTDGLKDDNHYIWNHFRETLKEINPDVVGVTMWTSSYKSGIKIIELAKEFNSNIKTCVGGYHVIAMDKLDNKTFIDNKLIDGIFVGHSDESLPAWIKSNFKERFIKSEPTTRKFEELPNLSRSSLLYPNNFSKNDMGMIFTSLGCPYDCSFCSNKLLTNRICQYRNTNQIREELEEIIKNYGVNKLDIPDANFLANKNKAFEIMKLFKEYNLNWNCATHIHQVDLDTINRLKDNGCNMLSIGIEAGLDERLIKLNKKSTVSQIINKAELLNKSNFKWKAHFICGWIDDTLEEMENLKNFAIGLNPSYISLNSFVPLPGTKIYDDYKNILDVEDVSIYNQLNPIAGFLLNINKEDYNKKFLEILNKFDDYNEQYKIKN